MKTANPSAQWQLTMTSRHLSTSNSSSPQNLSSTLPTLMKTPSVETTIQRQSPKAQQKRVQVASSFAPNLKKTLLLLTMTIEQSLWKNTASPKAVLTNLCPLHTTSSVLFPTSPQAKRKPVLGPLKRAQKPLKQQAKSTATLKRASLEQKSWTIKHCLNVAHSTWQRKEAK